MREIIIPAGARAVMDALVAAGHKAYAVGGCVRDTLCGIEPKDWDICTSALPEETKRCLAACGIRTVDTGLKHGTVTALLDGGQMYEVTTFRIDGAYSDNRHPDSVSFVGDVEADLARRDFTVNAMAYDGTVLVDPYRGQTDLARGVIACVGDPDTRFAEDALRILRALRFASVYGFRIDEKTAASIRKNKNRLGGIAAERVREELLKLLGGEGVLAIMTEFSEVITTVIPALAPCVGFAQNNPHHAYDVYGHIAHAVAAYRGDDNAVKMAILLHDIGKPLCYTEDERGGHFYGHGAKSEVLAAEILQNLRFDNKTKESVLLLVKYHDTPIEPTAKCVRRWLAKIGEKNLFRLLAVKRADTAAHSEKDRDARLQTLTEIAAVATEILREAQCFTLSDLVIKGGDMLALGVPHGKAVGEMLSAILEMVIDGTLPNEIEAQRAEVRRRLAAGGEKEKS